MRIGIDCRTILNISGGERAGVGHYNYYLVKNLLALDKKNDYVLFFGNRFQGIEEFKKYKNVTIKFFPAYQYKKYLPLIYAQVIVPAVLNRANLDLFHAPANILPLAYNKPSVVTVHDLGIYKFPEFFPKKFFTRQTLATKILVPRSLKKATKIIAVSKNTKKDIIEEFKVSKEKIEVVYEGVLDKQENCNHLANTDQILKKFGIGDKFILFLGTIEPRKNIVSLIKAFRRARLVYDSSLKDYQLIIAGGRGWQDEPVYQAISDANASLLGIKEKRTGLERRQIFSVTNPAIERRQNQERRNNQPIKYIGYVKSEEKKALLCRAALFVFPSFYEGFGLPVLEAMSLGLPVITSNVSSLPEVTGSEGAVLIDPNNENEIAEGLQRLITDQALREKVKLAGYHQAKSFSWRKCALDTLRIYNRILKNKTVHSK